MDQKSFEQGLLIGLNTAVAVLRDGGDRFVKFQINGHDWQKIGTSR